MILAGSFSPSHTLFHLFRLFPCPYSRRCCFCARSIDKGQVEPSRVSPQPQPGRQSQPGPTERASERAQRKKGFHFCSQFLILKRIFISKSKSGATSIFSTLIQHFIFIHLFLFFLLFYFHSFFF